jgi:hypothetical protein
MPQTVLAGHFPPWAGARGLTIKAPHAARSEPADAPGSRAAFPPRVRTHPGPPATAQRTGEARAHPYIRSADAVVAVEAKACESFDEEVRNWVHKEEAKNPRSPSHRLGVVDQYAKALCVRADALMELRYQLLHRTLSAALGGAPIRTEKCVGDCSLLCTIGL